MSADQITAEHKEEVNTDPAEAVDAAGQFESEKGGVINNDHDDGECAEKIETGLAFAILKARIDCLVASGSLRPKAHQLQFVDWGEIFQ